MDHVSITQHLERLALTNSWAPDGRLLSLRGLPCTLSQHQAWAVSYALLRAWRRHLQGLPVPGWFGRWCASMDLLLCRSMPI